MTEENFFKEIRKRDGRVVTFNTEKVTQAIFKAAQAVGGEDYSLAEEISKDVIEYLKTQKVPGLIPTVEEIQDAVEKILIERGHARTAKAYILYRDKRTRIREAKSELMDVVKDILMEGNRHEDLRGNNSPARKMHKIALAASQKYYVENLLPPEISTAHQRGNFHIHELGYYSKALDSLQVDISPVLKQSPLFDKNNDHPTHFFTTLLLLFTLIQENQSDLYGEQAFPMFDSFLGRLLRSLKYKPSREELEKNLKNFMYYLSSISCAMGAGSLKCSINVGLDTTPEGKLITSCLLRQFENKRFPQHRWPKIIFSLKKGVNFLREDPNFEEYTLALKSAIFGTPISFAFLDASYNEGADVDNVYFSNGMRVKENRHGSSGGKRRGNIASLTLNLPRLALSTKDEELFSVELDRLLRLGVRQLVHRFEVLSALKVKDLPYTMGYKFYFGSDNLTLHESVKEALKHGVMSIGFIGLGEAVKVLAGIQGSQERFYETAVKIVEHMSKRISSFNEEFDLNIVLSGANSEGELRNFVERDREEFGLVKAVTDKELYSSSFLLFQEDEGIERKISLEGKIHEYCSGGYSSKAVVLPGTEPEGLQELMLKLGEADIGHVQFYPLSSITREEFQH